jgi:hypothetical protein
VFCRCLELDGGVESREISGVRRGLQVRPCGGADLELDVLGSSIN